MKRVAVRWMRRNSFNGMLLLVFAGLFVYPIVRLLLMPWFPSLGPSGMEGARQASGGVSLEAIANTVRLSIASTWIAVPLGIGFAWLLERRNWRGNALLMLILWLIFFTPSYLLTTGWQIIFSLAGLHHGMLERMFFSQAGIVALLGLKGFPFACLAARSSWRAIGSEIVDAAHVHVISAWRRRILLLRLLLPAAGSAFAIVFIESIQEFGIPATLGTRIHLPIVTYSIYERLATTPVDFANAALLSWTLIALAAGAASVHLILSNHNGGALVHGNQRSSALLACGRTEGLIANAALGALCVIGIVIPGIAIIHAALEPVNAAAAAANPIPWDSLLYSTFYAAVGALFATTMAMSMISVQQRARGAIAYATDLLSLGNMAIPGLVLGAAYLIAFNSRWLPLYGTPALLVIAYVAAQVPVLLRFLQTPMGQIHVSMADAGRLHGLPWSSRVMDIQAPLLLTPFLWGWTMAFGTIFFELPISELLYPVGRAPVGVALVELNQTLRYTEETRLALVGIGLIVAIAVLVSVVLRVAVVPPMKKEASA